MAISEAYAGTATISTTEVSLVSGTTTLQSVTVPGVIQVMIDVSNMVAGDEYTIKIKDKVIAGGAQQSVYTAVLDGAQSSPFVTPTLILYHGWDVTMQEVAGTARSISWSIRKVG
jgi:hypothetical protein